jgi:hypothetical protein
VPRTGSVFHIIQSRNVIIKGGNYPASADLFMKVFGEKSEQIRLIGIDLHNAKKATELGNGVRPDAVVIE